MNLILHKVLATQDLDVWSRLRKEFFEAPYTEIYFLINRFYQKFDKLPTFLELEIVTRDQKHANYISALKELIIPEDLDIEIILQALINEYAQRQVLEQLSGYLEELVFKDVGEIVEDLTSISLDIEEKTEVSEQIIVMNDYLTIDNDTIYSRVPLGLNNDFDRLSLGIAPSEMFMFGGYRGSGKSVICANIACNQYLQDNSVLYFTIEMNGREIFNRYLSILTGVYEKHIKAGNLSSSEKKQIAIVRSGMTADGSEDLLEQFYKDEDFDKFEKQLITRPLKPNSQLITIDNSNLTVPNIDATIHNFKTKFGDKLKIVIVDYINQISVHDPYNWQTQIETSKKLKALAKKYDIGMITPYQISEDGKTRFSKGILDSPDWAFNITAVKEGTEGGHIAFECKKARSDNDGMNFASEMHWPTLKMLAHKNIDLNSKVDPIKSEDDLSQ